MDLSSSTLWWAATGLVIAAELATGTLYLLMVALGTAAAALAAHAGAPASTQLIAASVVGCGATALWHWRRARQPPSLPVSVNRDVNLDIGARVHVAAWGPDRTTRVSYRGTTWSARLPPGAPMLEGEHTVQAVEGIWLVLAPMGPEA